MLSILGAFISTIGLSICFCVQKKHLFSCGLIGALGWTIYLIADSLKCGTTLATFLAALIITQVSYSLARRHKTPITVYLIAGIIPLVPGLGLYRMMFAMLNEDYASAINYATLTFEVAAVIAGAIVIISLFPLLWKPPNR